MATMTTHGGAEVHTALHEMPKAAWNRATWGPIMMGAVTAIGLQLIFTVLGVAIGVSSVDGGETPGEVSMAAGAWWLISGSLAILVGGAVYGRTSGLPRALQLTLGAVGMWGVIAVFGFLVIWSGMGIAASSPLAMISGDSTSGGAAWNRGASSAGMSAEGIGGATVRDGGSGADGGRDEAMAARAARRASWWSVMGMVVGVGCAVAGAAMAVPKVVNDARRHA